LRRAALAILPRPGKWQSEGLAEGALLDRTPSAFAALRHLPRWGRIFAVVCAAAMPAAAMAQSVITSPAPDGVAVTIYRAPDRDADQALNLNWLGGYALVTERRTVDLPAGKATIRFEGVAAGMLPESALVTGLPAGVREKNLDADLLSARSLFARGFGRPVTLRRAHDKTGEVTEEPAVIRSGPDGGVILQTKAGFEAVNCGPLTESLIYDGVPPGLSARPTLSVETEAAAPARVTVTLAYLAWGFDWQANYVARMSADGKQAALTAWVTLASSDTTSFADADTAVVAGKVNREGGDDRPGTPDGELVFRCYASPEQPYPVAPPPPPAPMMMEGAAMDIVVTAQRRDAAMMKAPVMVQQEALGDLKFYRVPLPTTVAAMAQKQVALLDQPKVKVAVFYRAELSGEGDSEVRQVLRTRNRKEEGLGLALPAGQVTVMEPHDGALLPVGEGSLDDHAVGEDVDIVMSRSTGVTLSTSQTGSGDRWTGYEATATNARPVPVRLEAKLLFGDGQTLANVSAKLGRKDGRPLWAVTVPANGTATLRYRVTDTPEP